MNQGEDKLFLCAFQEVAELLPTGANSFADLKRFHPVYRKGSEKIMASMCRLGVATGDGTRECR
jgi:hypothetical protein